MNESSPGMSVGADSPERNKSRVMWLLNHSAARAFEVPMLKRIGFTEIFLPKKMPMDPHFRSGDVTFSEDLNITIPKEDLEILNNADWYFPDNRRAWEIANKYFSVIFFIVYRQDSLPLFIENFSGAAIWRAFGLDQTVSYGEIFKHSYGDRPVPLADSITPWLGIAYDHIAKNEPERLRDKSVFLPLGLYDTKINDTWTGSDSRILFVCPDLGFNSYYQKIYEEFKAAFKGFPYVIGGAQPLEVDDPAVLGFVPREEHERNMQNLRVMFYHSREPNHVHYHPFEAVRRGMPLVFMSDGMLDRLGGKGLPGRCTTLSSARRLIGKLLAGDRQLAEKIRKSQIILLKSMSMEAAEPFWRDGFARIRASLAIYPSSKVMGRRRRIGVLLPVAYRGGTLRGAQLVAQAIHMGSRLANEPCDVIFAYVDEPAVYSGSRAVEPINDIPARPYRWRTLSGAEAKRAMRFAGFDWNPAFSKYAVPDDSLSDCDLLVIVSDRLPLPLLPIKPYILLVFDYLQRYAPILERDADLPFLQAARQADRVLVTTRFTEQDALQYAGVSRGKLVRVPMLAPAFSAVRGAGSFSLNAPYFLWTTNAAPHKNHLLALEALIHYYENNETTLDCVVTGVESSEIATGKRTHLREVPDMLARHSCLRARVHWRGELADNAYRKVLSGAAFLWHAGRIDNGTFSVIEAAHLGIPSLSSDYPAMREIDAQFKLGLAWMNPDDSSDMAAQLESMTLNCKKRRDLLPDPESLSLQGIEHLAPPYWEAVRQCL